MSPDARPGNGWTGGQYSLLRVLLGVYFAVSSVAGREPAAGWGLVGVVAAIAGAAALVWGWRDRTGSLIALGGVLATLWLGPGMGAIGAVDAGRAGIDGPTIDTIRETLGLVGVVLVHVMLPGAPYGSRAARGRPDPGGGWHFPRAGRVAAWGLLIGSRGIDAALLVALHGHWPLAVGQGLAGLLVLLPRFRFAGWLALGLLALAQATLTPLPPAPSVGLLWLLAFAPAWIPPDARKPALLFYDGACGLCHRAVRFVLAEDASERAFRFAPLQGSTFRQSVPVPARAGLPDSIVVLSGNAELRVKSAAVLDILGALGGSWRVMGAGASLVPRAWRDAAYDVVATLRRRIFAAPEELCPVLPARLRARFEP